MRPLLLALALWPTMVFAETCDDVYVSCLEDCHIDFGLNKSRAKLGTCTEQCKDDLEACTHRKKAASKSLPPKKPATEPRQCGATGTLP